MSGGAVFGMTRVLVESPFAPREDLSAEPDFARRLRKEEDARLNVAYCKALCRNLALAGFAPYASHIFATQFLDDTDRYERTMGIELGLLWGEAASMSVVGIDRGISGGMQLGIARARQAGREVRFVSLPEWSKSWVPNGVDREAWRVYSDTLWVPKR